MQQSGINDLRATSHRLAGIPSEIEFSSGSRSMQCGHVEFEFRASMDFSNVPRNF